MKNGTRLHVIVATGLVAGFASSSALADPLDYDYSGMGGAGVAAAPRGRFCADCVAERPMTSLPSAPGRLATIVSALSRTPPARLGAATGDSQWLSGTARPRPSNKLPNAAGWRNIGIPTPTDEPVAMTLGVSMIDQQDVAMDAIGQNKALKFPSTRLLAGFRFKLGRAVAD